MLVLVIDTSSAATLAALVSLVDQPSGRPEPQLLAAESHVDARAHGERLAPSIERVLAGSGTGALGAVVAGVGPGPFTGLRVGLVTASVLADTLGIPSYGVCSLDGIGADFRRVGQSQDAEGAQSGELLVATDARRREVYWARYRDGERIGDPAVSRPAEVPLEGVTAMAGAGARQYTDVFDRPLRDHDYPDPLALTHCAMERLTDRATGERLVPLYLRRPDAVEPTVRKPVRQ
jgi:tRNA threonylcarbamoyl adenosine modification protein YeaZ